MKTVALAVVFLAPAIAADEVLERVLPGVAPFIMLFPAVVAAGLLHGTAVGLLTTLAGVAIAGFLWAGPRFDLGPENQLEGSNMALFLLCSFCILWAMRSRRASRAALARREAELSIALEAGALGIWEIDLATNRAHWDARVACMLGMEDRALDMDRSEQARFIDEADRQRVASEFSHAVRSSAPFASEFRGRTAQGEMRWFVSQAVVQQSERRVVGVLRDVTEPRRREDVLRMTIDAREMLIREADHRIKNSLQMVISLLTIQQQRMAVSEGMEAITSAIARVEAIAEAHNALQQSKDLRLVDFGKMLSELCAKLAKLSADTTIHCSLDGNLTLSADLAIPFALMVSEILTNALRHAFPAGVPGEITVCAVGNDHTATVSIIDDGREMPGVDLGNTGLGPQLIRSFAKQLGAVVEVDSAPGAGTRTVIRIAVAACDHDDKLYRQA